MDHGARSLLSFRAAVTSAAVVLVACADTALPGATLGTYAVSATLSANSCGTGLGAPTPWNFDVQISEQGSTLYWSYLDGSPPLSSTLVSHAAVLTATDTANVDGTPGGGSGPCSMTRTDTLRLELDSTAPPQTFTGTLEYAFSAASGADCTDQLSANGGAYDVLPCSMSYSLSGTRR